MCNAWQHPENCTCGFGGIGHLGVRGSDGFTKVRTVDWVTYVPPINPRSYESHTIPNAKCPVCGAAVFYYWNEYGSSVFFDDLGPPWPKHPCTDNSVSYEPIYLEPSVRLPKCGKWRNEGWQLVGSRSVKIVDSDLEISITLEQNGEEYDLFVEKYRATCTDNIADVLNDDSSIFFRKRKGRCELAILGVNGKTYRFSCRNITKRNANGDNKDVGAGVENSGTAIELAFRQAKKKGR